MVDDSQSPVDAEPGRLSAFHNRQHESFFEHILCEGRAACETLGLLKVDLIHHLDARPSDLPILTGSRPSKPSLAPIPALWNVPPVEMVLGDVCFGLPLKTLNRRMSKIMRQKVMVLRKLAFRSECTDICNLVYLLLDL